MNFFSFFGINLLYAAGGFVIGVVLGYMFKGAIKKELGGLLDEASNALDDTNKELKEKLQDAKKNL